MHPNMVFTEIIGSDIVNSVNGEIVYQKRLEEKMVLLKHYAKTKIGIDIKTNITTKNANYVFGQTYRNGENWSQLRDDIVVSVNRKYLPENTIDKRSKLDDLESLCQLLGIYRELFRWEDNLIISGSTHIKEDDYMKLFSIPVRKYIVKVPSDPTKKLEFDLPPLKQNKKSTWFDKLMQVFN